MVDKNQQPVVPTDRDWGGDTLSRFRYQAEITLQFCLRLILKDSDIVAVIPEHLEDIAIETETGWRFIQVKSRDPEQPLWTLSKLLERGGALRSLHRTFRSTENTNYPLEMILEGATKSNNLIQKLKQGADRTDLVTPVAKKLGIEESEASQFLERVILNDAPYPRSAINKVNYYLIHTHGPNLSQSEVSSIHKTILDEIERAMRGDALGTNWPSFLIHPATRPRDYEARLASKRLTKQNFDSVASEFTKPARPYLRNLVSMGGGAITELVRKIQDGGGSEEMILEARNLMANARYYRKEKEILNSDLSENILSDLRIRLTTYGLSSSGRFPNGQRPALQIWGDLLTTFTDNPANIDLDNYFGQDPMLLLGEACTLSDQCNFGWGKANQNAD